MVLAQQRLLNGTACAGKPKRCWQAWALQPQGYGITIRHAERWPTYALLLARALISDPDLLLLDEPSNHLDLPTMLWLEQFLQRWSGSFVLVSHDSNCWMPSLTAAGSCAINAALLCPSLLAARQALEAKTKAMRSAIRRSKRRSTASPAPNGWRPGARSTTTKIWPAKPNRWKNRSNG
jgi:hypothetical protein